MLGRGTTAYEGQRTLYGLMLADKQCNRTVSDGVLSCVMVRERRRQGEQIFACLWLIEEEAAPSDGSIRWQSTPRTPICPIRESAAVSL